jgi:putative tryptophan/tyrosine transport system substrate-binding protein
VSSGTPTVERVDRRTFLASIVGVLAPPVAVAAQPVAKVHRIGFLRQGPPPRAWIEALQKGLWERGYVEGRNLAWEFRLTDGSAEQLPRLAEELVRLPVDLIVASAAPAARAAKAVTATVPIVFAGVYNPDKLGLVQSMRSPGGNLTGVALAVDAAEMTGKRLQLLTELVPGLKRAGILTHPAHPTNAMQLQGATAAAHTLGVQLVEVPVRHANDLDSVLKGPRGIEGLLHVDTPFFTTHRARLVRAVASTRLPAIFTFREFVEGGALVSYGVDQANVYREAAPYVDKILKGAKPADLPVAQPTKFELVINLRTAKALGVAIPPAFLQRADQVID